MAFIACVGIEGYGIVGLRLGYIVLVECMLRCGIADGAWRTYGLCTNVMAWQTRYRRFSSSALSLS